METMEKYLTHTTHFGVDPELARKWYMCTFCRRGDSVEPHESFADSFM